MTQQFIDGRAAAGGPPIYTLSPTDARAVLAGAQAGQVGKPAAQIEDDSFPDLNGNTPGKALVL